jgi:ubiquinone/menaquinone biosynthesis C-methylase UbiE
MTTMANRAQFDSWNGDSGERWVASADERDRVLAPVGEVLIAVAAPSTGAGVLDIGCGCGATTLAAAAHVGDAGSATGIDLSRPMLDLARRRATSASATNTSFIHGDAQTHPFASGSADLVISRFGTMFFSDPEAAFANIATALRPGGRICLATWQPLMANEWLTVPGAALLRHTEPPTVHSDEPGMFGQSEPDRVIKTLHAAGFAGVAIEATEITLTLGASLDDAVDYLVASGPGRALLETIPEGAARAVAIADVRAALVDHHDQSGVRLGGGVWMITATKAGSRAD